MLLDTNEIEARINSPLNLLNRLKEVSTPKAQVIGLPPKAEDLIKDLDVRVAKTSNERMAGEVLRKTLNRLNEVIESADKPGQLSKVARDMGVVIDSLKEKDTNDDDDGPRVQVLIYRPQVLNESHYETIQASE